MATKDKINTWWYSSLIVLILVSAIGLVWYQSTRVIENNELESGSSKLDFNIKKAEDAFKANPENIAIGIQIVDGYLQKARETNNQALYAEIDRILLQFQERGIEKPEVIAKQAEVANLRHDFKTGLALITRAVNSNSQVAEYWGIKSDAELELGEYEAAEASLQTMIDLKPNFNSLTRVAYQRELRGDIEGAKEAFLQAISAGSAYVENIAWAHVELGKLLMRDQLDDAEYNFNRALSLFPLYAPAFEGLGRSAFVKGDMLLAGEYYIKAFTAAPTAGFATALAGFYETIGNDQAAKQYYALAEIAYTSNTFTNVDLEYAAFLADHGDVTEALRRAEAAFRERPSIYAADVYAWALFKNNRISESARLSKEARKFGLNDANVVYHASVIERANGNVKEANELVAIAQVVDQKAFLPLTQQLAQE